MNCFFIFEINPLSGPSFAIIFSYSICCLSVCGLLCRRFWVSPEEVQVSSGLPQGQGLWVQQAWVWHKPSWRRSSLTHHRAARTYTGLGKQTLGGHKQNLVCTRTQEKGAVTPHGTDPDLPVRDQESPVEGWVNGGLLQGQGHWVFSSAFGGPSEGGHHYLHYLHHNLASGQITGREHGPTLQ